MMDVDGFQSALLEWFSTAGRSFPWRAAEATRYEVFVAEFFLTQTPAENVATVYPTFIEQFPSLPSIDDSAEEAVRTTIRPLGFQRMRAAALKEIASASEELPGDVETMQTLPRVGPYVSNATLCFSESRSLPIVDRNVRRVYRRIWPTTYPDPDTAAETAFVRRLLPEDGRRARDYNLALLDLGAALCTASDPLCANCPVAEWCAYAAERPAD